MMDICHPCRLFCPIRYVKGNVRRLDNRRPFPFYPRGLPDQSIGGTFGFKWFPLPPAFRSPEDPGLEWPGV